MGEIERQLSEASSAAKKDDYDKALALCNAVLQAHPLFPSALRKRSEIYTRMGDLERAIADLTEVIKTGGEPSDYFFRGWRYLDNGNTDNYKPGILGVGKMHADGFVINDQNKRRPLTREEWSPFS